jgi:hypothetical protein
MTALRCPPAIIWQQPLDVNRDDCYFIPGRLRWFRGFAPDRQSFEKCCARKGGAKTQDLESGPGAGSHSLDDIDGHTTPDRYRRVTVVLNTVLFSLPAHT